MMSRFDKYKELKKVMFNEFPAQHARLLAQLYYDNLKQGELFRALVEGYVEGDENIFNFVQKYKLNKKVSKRNVNIAKKERELLKRTENQFALSSTEIEGIFDILEQEHFES